MKKILVPTDFSQYADKALNYAVELAKMDASEIVLLHVVDLVEYNNFSKYRSLIKEYNTSTKKELYYKLNSLKNKITSTFKVAVSVALYDGDNIAETILYAASANEADLIIMGTQGANGIIQKLFGSKAAHVINRSNVPVLTIPLDYDFIAPKKILLAIDDADAEIKTLKPVFEIAKLFGASVSVMVFTEEEAEGFEVMTHTRNVHFIQQKLKRVFNQTSIDINHLSGEDFDDTVQRFIVTHNVNMLAMVTHKRNFLENIFNSSMTQKMCYHSTVPLLSLHNDGLNEKA
jgi:nucleotide-binding universal stress UspA family protein